MKKTFLLITFLLGGSFILLLATLSGCKSQYYQFIYKSPNISLWNQMQFVEESDTVSYQNLSIIDSLNFELLVASRSSNFGNQLCAQNIKDYYTPSEKIVDIKVYPLYNYNNQYPAQSDMSNSCRFNIDNSDADTKEAIIQALNESYLSENALRIIQIRLNDAPETAAQQQFIIELRTEANAVIRGTSETIYLTK